MSSQPAGARVISGSVVLGTTPLVVRLDGETTVRVLLDGYAERKVVLRPGDSPRTITLVPLF